MMKNKHSTVEADPLDNWMDGFKAWLNKINYTRPLSKSEEKVIAKRVKPDLIRFDE